MIIIVGRIHKERLCRQIFGATVDTNIVGGGAVKEVAIANDGGVTGLDADAVLRNDVVVDVGGAFEDIERAAVVARPAHNGIVADLDKVAVESINVEAGGNGR